MEKSETRHRKLNHLIAQCDKTASTTKDVKDVHVHEKLQMAEDLVDLKLNQFMQQSEMEKASDVILSDSIIDLTRRESMRLLELIENPPPMNAKLKKLLESNDP